MVITGRLYPHAPVLFVVNRKHTDLDNNQEGLISGHEQFGAGDRHSTSEIVDEKTQMELYWPPFEGAVQAGVLSVMCANNLVNGVYVCENNHTENTILKSWGGERIAFHCAPPCTTEKPGLLLQASKAGSALIMTARARPSTLPSAALILRCPALRCALISSAGCSSVRWRKGWSQKPR